MRGAVSNKRMSNIPSIAKVEGIRVVLFKDAYCSRDASIVK